VLLEGSHTLERCREVSEVTLKILFEELRKARVFFGGMILKTNMVLPGKDSDKKASPQEVAAATLELFKKVLPNNLGGEAFLSGGQSEIQATENLNAINQSLTSFSPVHGAAMHQPGSLPWPVTFSYARALQDGATKAWQGKKENLAAAQKVFLHRAKMNSLASTGKYDPEMEKGFSISDGGQATQD
jgi:fructose-bisphosphate aldolase class I